jgi:hypothetical protein
MKTNRKTNSLSVLRNCTSEVNAIHHWEKEDSLTKSRMTNSESLAFE